MKKTIKHLDQTVQELEHNLQCEHKLIRREIPAWGAHLGRANIPTPMEPNAEGYYRKIAARYEGLYHQVTLKLNGTVQMLLGSLGVQRINEQVSQHEKEIEELTSHKTAVREDQQKIPLDTEHISYGQYVFLLIALGFFDCLSMTGAFLGVFGDIVIIAIAMGFTIGIGILLLSKTATLAFRDHPNRTVKKVVLWIIIPILVFACIIFGVLRYRQSIHSEHESFFSPLVFVAINLITLACSIFVVYLYFPSIEQVRHFRAWRKFERQLYGLDKRIRLCKSKLENFQHNKSEESRYRLELRQHQRTYYDVIQTLYKSAVTEFIESNVRARPDKQYPQAFHAPVQLLDLKVNDEVFSHPLNESR